LAASQRSPEPHVTSRRALRSAPLRRPGLRDRNGHHRRCVHGGSRSEPGGPAGGVLSRGRIAGRPRSAEASGRAVRGRRASASPGAPAEVRASRWRATNPSSVVASASTRNTGLCRCRRPD